MKVITIPAGIYDANCYILMDEDSKEAVVLDPGGDYERIQREITRVEANVKEILLTHGHFDHVGAVNDFCNKLDIPFFLSKIEEEYMEKDNEVFGSLRRADGYLSEGDEITFGRYTIKVIETPGHTKGGLCFLVDNKIFTGDTLFQGSIGRTDFLGGNFDEIIDSIGKKIFILDDNVEVYPGHGPKSTVGYEKRFNPFF